MPVCDEGGHIVVFATWHGRGRGAGEEGREREEVAGPSGAVGHEGEYFGYQALLDGCFLLLLAFPSVYSWMRMYQLRVELRQARLPGIVENQHGADHVSFTDHTRNTRLDVGCVAIF